jgi:hypothetical protein
MADRDAAWWAGLRDQTKEVCPSCEGDLVGPTCYFSYSTWRCLGCGAVLDSRVVMPKMVLIDSPGEAT